jgi:hypothetical protein
VVQVRHLQRYPLTTSSPAIAGHLAQVLSIPPLREQAALACDATGVGAAVVDPLTKAHLSLIAVTITGGDKVPRDTKTRYSVPKRKLVGYLHVWLQTGRRKIASALPEAEALVKAWLACHVKITTTAHDTDGAWRDGMHDDLMLAGALACWYGARASHRSVTLSITDARPGEPHAWRARGHSAHGPLPEFPGASRALHTVLRVTVSPTIPLPGMSCRGVCRGGAVEGDRCRRSPS